MSHLYTIVYSYTLYTIHCIVVYTKLSVLNSSLIAPYSNDKACLFHLNALDISKN